MAEPAYTVASDSETTGDEKSSSPFPEIAIGIDIGTSQCSVAVWSGSHVELLRNTRNQKLIRSYVTFKDETPTGGVTNQLAHEHDMLSGEAIFNIKRLVGRADTDPVVHSSKSLPFMVQTLNIGVRPFIAALVKNVWRSTTPEEVLAIFLIELRAMAEARLRRPVRNVVLTIPVSFSRFQLTRVERACAMAGLQVLRLMPEPTAVALLYAQQQSTPENLDGGSEKIALIFNMGAGFCDVAITATAGGVSQIKALTGMALGGEDVLQNTMRHVFPDMDRKMGLLRVATQDAIHKLTSQPHVQIEVDMGNGGKICKVLDREEFEEVNREIFAQCEGLIKTCLSDAKIGVEDLNDVILVGGCSNIPKVRDTVKGVCGRDFYAGIDPFEAAVRGAALEGAVASGVNDPFGSLDLLTIQVTTLGIGIRADGNAFIPIIHQNTTMPVRRDMIFTTVCDNQAEALIVVYEGNEGTVEKNHLLGYFKITGIPPAPKGVPEINVCFDIDASNVLRVFVAESLGSSVMEVRMPTVDDGHGWCAEALNRTYGSTLDLMTVQRKMAH
ncbi:heat shock 70 kDa protein 8 [Phtheirospermum japonicum]|uniref:Heat shock 70 kDa protein 8 n=1 Tax=Phtheirospermum japonicum TaxID=374723 RepID=A0A830BIV4_9LAMI|nr:heat shock 70 kDa protein 8 [Phtheirospermum japonicum]